MLSASGFVKIPGMWMPSRGLALSRTEDKWSQTPRLPTPVQAPGQSTTLLTWWGGEVGGGRLFLRPAALHHPPATSRVQESRDFAQSSSSVGGVVCAVQGGCGHRAASPAHSGGLGSTGEGTIFFFIYSLQTFFFNVDHFFKVFTECVMILLRFCFGFLAERHRGSQLPDQGLNHAGGQSLNHWATREVPWGLFPNL